MSLFKISEDKLTPVQKEIENIVVKITVGVCPQWECYTTNIASIELAKSIGYYEYDMANILEE